MVFLKTFPLLALIFCGHMVLAQTAPVADATYISALPESEQIDDASAQIHEVESFKVEGAVTCGKKASSMHDIPPRDPSVYSFRFQECFYMNNDEKVKIYKVVGWVPAAKNKNIAKAVGVVKPEDCCTKAGKIADLQRQISQTTNIVKKEKPIVVEKTYDPATGHQPISKQFNDACETFISKTDGSYGPLGKRLADELGKPQYSQFLDKSFQYVQGMKTMCPNYKNMTPEQRKFMWVWTFTSMAQIESTCGTHNSARGPTSMAVGMLMLEAPEVNRDRRSDVLQAVAETTKASDYTHCSVRNISDPTQNVLCGLDIMFGHLIGQYGEPKLIGSEGEKGYWQELNKKDGKIPNLVRGLQSCGK